MRTNIRSFLYVAFYAVVLMLTTVAWHWHSSERQVCRLERVGNEIAWVCRPAWVRRALDCARDLRAVIEAMQEADDNRH